MSRKQIPNYNNKGMLPARHFTPVPKGNYDRSVPVSSKGEKKRKKARAYQEKEQKKQEAPHRYVNSHVALDES